MRLYARPHLTQKIPDFTAQKTSLFISTKIHRF